MSRRRDWRVAAGLSLVPGLGQLYNSQPLKALFFLLGTGVTIAPALVLITIGERVGRELLVGGHYAGFLLFSFGSILVFLALLVLGLFLWASAVSDARRTAQTPTLGEDSSGRRWWFFSL